MIKICNVEKTYNDGVNILSNFNFEANEGELIGVVGPIGSGKSTLLNIIAGVENINFGQVIIDNIDITSLSKEELASFRERYIGLIFQHHALFPSLSCLENVAISQMIVGIEEEVAFKQAERILKQLELAELKYCLPHNMSEHQKQRVALASALVKKPRVLLVDELTQPNGIQDYLAINLLTEVKKKYGTTIFMVIKNNELMKRADRLLVIPNLYN